MLDLYGKSVEVSEEDKNLYERVKTLSTERERRFKERFDSFSQKRDLLQKQIASKSQTLSRLKE